MKLKLIAGLSTLLTLLVLGKIFEKPLLAQVRAALTQNIDEPGRNPYQEYYFSGNATCPLGSQFCNFNFSKVPAGKRLVITHVSAYVDVVNGTLPNCNIESDFGGSQYASAFFTGVRGPGGVSTRVFINQDLQMYFGAGETPHGFCGLVSTTDSFSGAGTWNSAATTSPIRRLQRASAMAVVPYVLHTSSPAKCERSSDRSGVWVLMGVHMVDVLPRYSPDHARGS